MSNTIVKKSSKTVWHLIGFKTTHVQLHFEKVHETCFTNKTVFARIKKFDFAFFVAREQTK